MSRTIGFDCPSLAPPKVILRDFARALAAYTKARDRFIAFEASLPPGSLSDPTPEVADRMDRLEARHEALMGPMVAGQAAAMTVMQRLGAEVNGRGVRVGRLLFQIVQDEEAPQPAVIVVDLKGSICLG